MRLYTVDALISDKWHEWKVLAINAESAINATGVLGVPDVHHQSINAYEESLQALVLATPSQGEKA